MGSIFRIAHDWTILDVPCKAKYVVSATAEDGLTCLVAAQKFRSLLFRDPVVATVATCASA